MIARANIPAEALRSGALELRVRVDDGRYVTLQIRTGDALETLDPTVAKALLQDRPEWFSELQQRPARIDVDIDSKPREVRNGASR